MIVNKRSLLKAAPIIDMVENKRYLWGFSWGLTECGYDIRIKQAVSLSPENNFVLASSMEEFNMPDHLMGRVLNKSTWARLGVDASMTTNIEPGWRGFLTLELRYCGKEELHIQAGVGIAQVIFELLMHPAEYQGKYQDQKDEPVPAIRV